MELTYMWFVVICIAAVLGVWILLTLTILTVLTIADVVLLTPVELVRHYLVRPTRRRVARQTYSD